MGWDPLDEDRPRKKLKDIEGQGDLFGTDALPATTANSQAREVARVGGAIGDDVLAFARSRVGREFHMEDLRSYVEARGHRAPDSAGRILRLLRQHGRLDYSVVSRAQSLYRVEAVA